MKVTDLMIGDLILINNTPHKIQAIDSIDAEIQADDELYYVGEDRHHSENKIEPIPLTTEILEKNGFEMFKYDGWVHYYRIFGNSAIPFVLHSMIGGEMLSQEVDIFSTSTNTNCGIDVNYVHELQHALRLCRLNKLADNFKL